jgi:membrane associated rhomboid family serine protease
MLAQGATLSQPGGDAYVQGALFITREYNGDLIGLSEGQWWRLITAAFLHAGLFHLGTNMLMLWWIGAPVERAIGHARFLAVYLVSALAGAAGALLLSPDAATVGASGAIFGILGAALVFERQRHYVLGGSALSIIVLNLILTFAFAAQNVSIGSHVGGLIGGAGAGLALSRLGRGHPIYGRPGTAGVLGIAAVGVVSVAVAYLRVQSLA